MRRGSRRGRDALAAQIGKLLDPLIFAHPKLRGGELDRVGEKHLALPRAGKFEITAPVVSMSMLPSDMAVNNSMPVLNSLNCGSRPFRAHAPRWSASQICPSTASV